MPKPSWTPAQKQAIDTNGRSVLVSAGAGSGKTAVLAERCVHLVMDAEPSSHMDRLLVVTFTEAAAAQMRDRIAQALRERLKADPTSIRVRQQLALLDGASISTLHAFCKRVLDRYFAQAGVEPASPIMDAQDASILRQGLAEAVFRDAAAQSGEPGDRFHSLIQCLGAGRESSLIQLVLNLDAFLDSIADPEDWLAAAAARFDIKKNSALPDTWRTLLGQQIRRELDDQLDHVSRSLQAARSNGDIGELFVPSLEAYADELASWRNGIGDGNPTAKALDAACANGIGKFSFPAIPDARGKEVKSLPPDKRATFNSFQVECREIKSALFEKRLQSPFGRFTCKGWAEGLQRTAPHVQTLIELVTDLRKRYADQKEDLGVLDFSDLERRTLKVLRDDESGVGRGLRDKFDHVLVDEFQDVNPIQAEILRRVSRENDPHRADNLFAVGDIKQSIYRFRLAEPRLFLERLARFRPAGESPPPVKRHEEPTLFRESESQETKSPGVAIDLVENFRSDEPVIDAVNAAMTRLMTPDLGGVHYDARSRLVHGLSKSTAVKDTPGIELHMLEDTARASAADNGGTSAGPSDNPQPEDANDWERIEREAWVIARRIELLHAAGTPYCDIVILLRSLAQRAPLMIRALSRMGVPVHADVAGGFFDALEVNDCLSLLAVLDNSQQDLPLAALMRSPVLGEPFTDSELVFIRTHPATRHGYFHAAVMAYAKEGKDDELRNKVARMLDRLAGWRNAAHEKSLSDLLWQLLHETNYLAYVEGLPQGEQRRANLIALHDHARKFGTFERQGLHRFLDFINQMRDAEMDLEPAPLKHASADVVRVMSIHRSKGLEFPVVFVAELGKRFNIGDATGSILFDRELGLGLKAVDVEQRIIYPTLAHQLVSRQIRAESLSEEMRVLYVALTRAKNRLILVGTGNIEKLDEHAGRIHADGPLPALLRRSVSTALDWIVPAISAAPANSHRIDRVAPHSAGLPSVLPPGKAAPLFHTMVYPAAAMSGWTLDPPKVVHADEHLLSLSKMAELPAELVATGPAANIDVLKRRLTSPYRAASLTATPAVVAASELKRRWESGPQIDGEPTATAPAKHSTARDFRFAPPEFIAVDDLDASTRRGTSTHTFLQHVDLRRTCNRADLESQLQSMIERNLVLATEADEINLDEAAWFFESPIGHRMLNPKAKVRREWPFVMAASPQRFDPTARPIDGSDQLLVRGIVDCLLNDDGRWDVVDYKTDRVSGTALTERAQLYRGQLSIYGDAVEKLWPGKVGRKWLVFLNARQCIEV